MTCDVCQSDKDIAGVASSTMGAFSLCFCKTCIKENAEPYFMFEYTLDSVGLEVADWVKTMKTYKDGKYITWDEFVLQAPK